MSERLSTAREQAPVVQVINELLGHVLARIDQQVLAAVTIGDLLQLLAMPINGCKVTPAQVLSLNQVFIAVFQADEFDHAIQLKGQLVMMHDVEQDDLMMIVPEPLQHRLKLIEVSKEVTEDHDDLAPAQAARDITTAAVEGRSLHRIDLVEGLRHPQ